MIRHVKIRYGGEVGIVRIRGLDCMGSSVTNQQRMKLCYGGGGGWPWCLLVMGEDLALVVRMVALLAEGNLQIVVRVLGWEIYLSAMDVGEGRGGWGNFQSLYVRRAIPMLNHLHVRHSPLHYVRHRGNIKCYKQGLHSIYGDAFDLRDNSDGGSWNS